MNDVESRVVVDITSWEARRARWWKKIVSKQNKIVENIIEVKLTERSDVDVMRIEKEKVDSDLNNKKFKLVRRRLLKIFHLFLQNHI